MRMIVKIKGRRQRRSGADTINKEDTKRRRELPPIADSIWDKVNEIRKERNVTWQDLFTRFANYQDWLAHLLSLPIQASRADKINAVTTQYYMPLWLSNIYQNFLKEHIQDLPDIRTIKDSGKGRPAIVIGAGPSLDTNNYLKLLAESSFYRDKKGIIIVVSRALKKCLEAGVVPDYMVLLDPEPMMLEHIDHEIVDKYASEITGIFPITVYPDVLNRWGGKKIYFIAAVSAMTIPNVQATISGLFPKLTELDGCGNAGTFSLNFACYLNCNPIALIGLDFSFLPDTPIETTPYYKAFRPSYKTEKEMIDECYYFHTHSFFKNNCYTDDIYHQFMLYTVELARINREKGIRVYNCTGRGILDEPKVIENMWFEDFLSANPYPFQRRLDK